MEGNAFTQQQQLSNNILSHDPQMFAPPLNLPTLINQKLLKRRVVMFSYDKWISKFSDKIYPLNKLSKFPLTKQQVKSFESLKIELANATVQMVDSVSW